MYSFTLTGATRTALDPSQTARRATVTVVASDDPFGIIEFQSASPLNVSEDVGFVNLTVLRNGGSIGQLSVNYSVSSDTATKGADYESFGSGRYFCLFALFVCVLMLSVTNLEPRVSPAICQRLVAGRPTASKKPEDSGFEIAQSQEQIYSLRLYAMHL